MSLTFVQKKLVNLGIFVVLGLLGAGALFYERHYTQKKELSKEQSEKLFSFNDVTAIQELTLTTPKATFILHRQPANARHPWMLTTPLLTAADPDVVKMLLTELVTLKYKKQLPAAELANTDNSDIFGFKKEPLQITLKGTNGQAETLHVGITSSFDYTTYAQKVADNSVYTVTVPLRERLNKDLLSLRDKHLLRFSPTDSPSLTVEIFKQPESGTLKNYEIKPLNPPLYQETPAPSFSLNSSLYGSYSLQTLPAIAQAPLTLANDSEIRQLWQALSAENIKTFLQEQPTAADLTTFKLDKPAFKLTLTLNQQVRSFIFSQAEGRYLAQEVLSGGEAPAAIVELTNDEIWQKVLVQLDDLSDKHALHFVPAQITSFSLQEGPKQLKLRAEPPSGAPQTKRTWQLETPEPPQKLTAAALSVANLLQELRELTINEEIHPAKPEYFAKPLVVELATGKAEKLYTLKFGETVQDLVYLEVTSHQTLPGLPPTSKVILVTKKILEALKLTPEAYQEKTPPPQNKP